MEISDSVRSALVRKGNELFNLNDIEGAYRCYITASHYGGVERIADHYYYNKKELVKAYRLYKLISKEDSNFGGNERAKIKIEDICKNIANVLRKWLKEDENNSMERPIKNHYYAETENIKEKFYIREEKQEKK